MNIALGIIIFILLITIYLQNNSKMKRNKHLQYISQKLEEIIKNNSTERLMLFTTDKELKKLMININELLDYNHKNIIKYNKAEISIRKMLSNISHDLKTPLTVVLGYVETLKLKISLNNEKSLMVANIYDKTIEVLSLINKFFDLAKLESGDKHLPLSKININELCRKNILDFYDILNNKDFEVFINVPDKNIYVFGNEEAINRILNNLISNAVKYGEDGKFIELNLKEDESYAYIEIIDKGKGINEMYKEAVFERMYTLEDSRNKSYQGSGLGLTITKKLIETLGGEIHLNSKPYEKTIFSFTLKKINY